MRTLLLFFLLLGTSALAQEFPTKGPATGDPDKNASQPKVYQGCMIRTNGNVMLADQAWDEPATMLIGLVCESV